MKETTDERILRHFKPSDAAWATALDLSGFAFGRVATSHFPTRGLLAGLALTLAAYLSRSIAGVVISLVLTVALMFLERSRRRDFLTRTHLVRESGLFGVRRFALPLQEVVWVKVSRPTAFGEAFDAAD